MQDKFTYEYAIIRVVPKVEREEFFNVGVILFSKSKRFLDVKFHIDQKKLAAFPCDIEYETLTKYLQAWQAICQGDPNGGPIGKLDLPDRFRWLAACRSTVIQSSKTHSGLCHDPSRELMDIFEKMVL